MPPPLFKLPQMWQVLLPQTLPVSVGLDLFLLHAHGVRYVNDARRILIGQGSGAPAEAESVRVSVKGSVGGSVGNSAGDSARRSATKSAGRGRLRIHPGGPSSRPRRRHPVFGKERVEALGSRELLRTQSVGEAAEVGGELCGRAEIERSPLRQGVQR
jgi:hypothetical protein